MQVAEAREEVGDVPVVAVLTDLLDESLSSLLWIVRFSGFSTFDDLTVSRDDLRLDDGTLPVVLGKAKLIAPIHVSDCGLRTYYDIRIASCCKSADARNAAALLNRGLQSTPDCHEIVKEAKCV